MTMFSGFEPSSGFELLLKSFVRNVPIPNEATAVSCPLTSSPDSHVYPRVPKDDGQEGRQVET